MQVKDNSKFKCWINMKNIGNLKQLYSKHLQISGTNLLLVLTVPFTSGLWPIQPGSSTKQMMSLKIPSQNLKHNCRCGKKKGFKGLFGLRTKNQLSF